MGMYDTLVDGVGHLPCQSAQVKCFRGASCRLFHPGDTVPPLYGFPPPHYSIALAHAAEGFYANVHGDIFIGVTRRPMFRPVLDKWGTIVEEET